MTEDRFFTQLAPPPGGWQRLLTRRDAPPPGRQRLGLPLAATAALTLALLQVLPRPHELQLPWSGGRLVAQPSDGVALRVEEQSRATALPSDNPRVHFYWLQGNVSP